jgi:uncharacterized protein involved in exopolysaccharide biosynthesis
LSPLALWLAVRKNWLLACIITLTVTAGVAFYTFGQTRIYEVSATILFDPRVPRPLGGQVQVDDSGTYWNNKEYYRTQHWMIQSMRVATQVVRELELNKDQGFMNNLPASTSRPPAKGVSVENAAQLLSSRLSIEPIRESRLTTVKYQDARDQDLGSAGRRVRARQPGRRVRVRHDGRRLAAKPGRYSSRRSRIQRDGPS